jgi:hypothetical protein
MLLLHVSAVHVKDGCVSQLLMLQLLYITAAHVATAVHHSSYNVATALQHITAAHIVTALQYITDAHVANAVYQ